MALNNIQILNIGILHAQGLSMRKIAVKTKYSLPTILRAISKLKKRYNIKFTALPGKNNNY